MSRKSASYGNIIYWVEELKRTDNMFFSRYEWKATTGDRDSIEECEQYIEREVLKQREQVVKKRESEEYGIKTHKVI